MATILITGANRGIGLEFVRQFLARGDSVLGTHRSANRPPALDALPGAESRLETFVLDVADGSSMQDFADRLDGRPIDVFINNAGVYGPRNGFGSVTADDWMQVLSVNSMAPLLLTQLVIDNLRAGAARKLIYITSKMGSIDDNKGGGSYIYRSSKAALNAVVKSIAVDLGADGFSVAVVHPGWVRTDMGGPNALIDTQTSVSGMMRVIDELDEARSGGFYNYDGATIPW